MGLTHGAGNLEEVWQREMEKGVSIETVDASDQPDRYEGTETISDVPYASDPQY